jgi:hypothetical protein
MIFNRRFFSLLAMLLVSLAVASGCGSDEPRQSVEGLLTAAIDDSELREIDLRVEEGTSTCMRLAGWDYVPVDRVNRVDSGPAEKGTEEFGKSFGYGITLAIQNETAVDVGENKDQNDEIVANLSEAERDAYRRDLEGYVELGVESPGCRYQAEQDTLEAYPLARPEIRSRIQEAYFQVRSHPDVLSATERWASCMSDRLPERSWSSPDELPAYIELAAIEVVQMPTGLMSEEAKADKLALLTSAEAEIWVADRGCQAESGLEKVESEIESQIVNEILEDFPVLRVVTTTE